MSAKRPERKKIVLERTWKATLDEVWELWTSKRGIEAWWGPDGFSVTVQRLELRAGGVLEYTMTATGADQIRFMRQSGMPLSTSLKVTIDEVAPPLRLRMSNLADFIPGVEPYPVSTEVQLQPVAQGVRLVLTLEAMHDEVWTQRMAMGWEQELGKLEKLLAA